MASYGGNAASIDDSIFVFHIAVFSTEEIHFPPAASKVQTEQKQVLVIDEKTR